ncbi:MAG: AmmeMemoRadiSam system radical SAM enzyme [Candidatus Aenigmatarchaeota archaeon]
MFKVMGENFKKAVFWKKEKNGVRCELCARRCFITEGKRGFCMARKNIGNKLFSLNYGKVVAINTDPIEKKPLYHFYPGSFALSYACAGCNWACEYCCNFDISHVESPETLGTRFEPEQIVEMAEKEDVKIISHTYTEPTVFFEFAYEVAKLAHKKGIKNTFVTNGYMTENPLKKISKFLDAATVDFKASGDEGFLKNHAKVPSIKPVFDTLRLMKKLGIHIEITNLIIPKIGESIGRFREFVNWVLNNLGPETPVHIIRFFPSYKMTNLGSTPLSALENFVKEARKIGLTYVYIGNVPGHGWENTYCPNCGNLLIERFGFEVKSKLTGEKCPKCGKKLKGFILEK